MEINIRGRKLTVPVIQGGMGVGISLDRLAGAVASCGGMGTISTALCGYKEPDFEKRPHEANLRALDRQVRHAKELSLGRGMVAVNAMVATTQYADSIRTALRAGADAIVCGAGLPKDLPGIAQEVAESDGAIAPIVSSQRAAVLLCRLWDKHYGRIPDFIILEGPLAGGHLGFTPEDAQMAQEEERTGLDTLLADVLDGIKPYIDKYGHDIPVFVAGGIKNGTEMAEYMKKGAAGGQFATRFITTTECDASDEYKHKLLKANKEDVTIIKSPVGMPGRALKTPLIDRVESGTQGRPEKCTRCLKVCDPKTTLYCISDALVAAAKGDYENGLFFCGSNVGSAGSVTTVKDEIDTIMAEWRSGQ